MGLCVWVSCFPQQPGERASSPSPDQGLLRAGAMSPPIWAQFVPLTLPGRVFDLFFECGGRLPRCPQGAVRYSGEAAWLQAEGAPQTRTGSQLTSTSTCLLLLRLPAQRSPSASGKLARLPELPLFPEQKELDEVAAARARLHEELLAVTEAGNPREAVEASLGNLRSRRHTSHCSGEFIKPKRLNVNSSELNFGPVRVCCAQHVVFIQKEPTALFSQLDTKSLRIASTLLGVTSPRQPLRWRRHWAESGFPGVGAGCLCPKSAVAAITLTGSLAYHLGLL